MLCISQEAIKFKTRIGELIKLSVGAKINKRCFDYKKIKMHKGERLRDKNLITTKSRLQ